MTDTELQLLREQLWATARDRAPPAEEIGRWVHSLDTEGGPDHWFQASLYLELQTELLRRRSISESR